MIYSGAITKSSKDLSIKNTRARRSTCDKRLTTGRTSLDKPFYISNVVGGKHRASIYNDTEPKVRHFVDGVETSTTQFDRGEDFIDCFYDEGYDHYTDFVYNDMGYVDRLGFDADIEKLQHGSCTTIAPSTCTATSKYTVRVKDAVGNLTYEWIAIDAVIVGANNQREVTVTSNTMDKHNRFVVECAVSDTYTTTICRFEDHHDRVVKVVLPFIDNMNVESIGYCEYDSGFDEHDCTTTSVFTVSASNADSYFWLVDNGSIISGQGTTRIVVETVSGHNELITATCYAKNAYGSAVESISTIAQHKDLNVPLRVLNIVELTHGSCSYSEGSTCIASGTYGLQFEGKDDTIVWVCDGGIITSGQGTGIVVIETEGNSDTEFTLAVYVSNSNESDSMSKKFTHSRELQAAIFDRHVVYDSSNIAQEFIAC